MPPQTAPSFTSMLILVLFLGVIAGISFLLKRKRIPGLSSPVQMKTIGGLSLGQRERVIVVEIGDEWHVLGVTPHSITPITQLIRQVPPITDNGPPADNFIALLAARLKKK